MVNIFAVLFSSLTEYTIQGEKYTILRTFSTQVPALLILSIQLRSWEGWASVPRDLCSAVFPAGIKACRKPHNMEPGRSP